MKGIGLAFLVFMLPLLAILFLALDLLMSVS